MSIFFTVVSFFFLNNRMENCTILNQIYSCLIMQVRNPYCLEIVPL